MSEPSAEVTRANWQVPAFARQVWRSKSHSSCVIVPVINEGNRIAKLLRRMHSGGTHEICDIIIVDGGSTDGSLEASRPRSNGVRALLTKTGPGRLSAQLLCGYAFALEQGYLEIVTIDGNDKDDPEAIPRILTELRRGYDFVQASRFLPGGRAENTPKVRDLAIRWIHAPMLRWFSGYSWTDTTQGFRGYSNRLLLDERVDLFRELFSGYELLAYLSYRAPRLGFRCVEIPSVRRYPAGKVPTKISSLRGNLSVLLVLVRACFGCYDP